MWLPLFDPGLPLIFSICVVEIAPFAVPVDVRSERLCRELGRPIHLVYVCLHGFGGEQVMIEFKGSHFGREVILSAVRWPVAYPVSYRQREEMMEEHDVEMDHATLNRWVRVGAGFPRAQAPVGLPTGIACPLRKFATEP